MTEPTKRTVSASAGGPSASDDDPLAPGTRPLCAGGRPPALTSPAEAQGEGETSRADAVYRDWLWRVRYSPDGAHALCPRCGRQRRFHRLRRRPSYSCDSCGFQLSPTRGTIFEKSRTSLCLWFRAVAFVGEATGPVSGRRLGDEIGVPPRTAQRMLTRIVAALAPASPHTAGGIGGMQLWTLALRKERRRASLRGSSKSMATARSR